MNWAGKMGLAGVALMVAWGVLISSIPRLPERYQRGVARNDALQVVNGIRAFYTEYGRYPKTDRDCVPVDRKLLAILTGNDSDNPRRIIFLELPAAKMEKGRWVGGINPETGSFVDPWGTPYLVKMDTDYDYVIDNPYSANAGDAKLHTTVIVWSAGVDGIFGKPGQYRGSKDIVSW